MKKVDINPYMPVNPALIEENPILRVRYLGYYLKWHPQSAYYFAVENGWFFRHRLKEHRGTYSKYNSLDDKIDDYHFFTTYIKFGIGRATYEASQEVRSGGPDTGRRHPL